jgi:phage/plasmid-associated DNA primase
MKKETFEKVCVEFEDLEEMIEELEYDKSYHFRICNQSHYIFFGDIDGYNSSIENFINQFKFFLESCYNLTLNFDDFFYTENKEKAGSYHYSIPKWNLGIDKLREIHTNFKNTLNKEEKKVIDTSIYSDHWFRCPNQSKGNNGKGVHKIKRGTMLDFIIEYIPANSENINNIEYKTNKRINELKYTNIKQEVKQQIINSEYCDDVKLIEKLLNILNSEYYDDYNEWYKIGMILKHKEKELNISLFEIFDTFSKKSKKYDKHAVKKYWNGFNPEKITITIGSLNEYAKKSNSSEYKNIMRDHYDKNKIEITEKYICETLNKMAGDYFFFKNKILYSFDIHNKLWFEDEPETIKKYINDELYDYLFELLNDCIYNDIYLQSQIKQLKNYCLKNKGQEEILRAYKTRYLNNCNTIEFDTNPYLIGFTNGIYDLQKNIFRCYEYNDYMTTNTGYAYRKATTEEKKCAEDIIYQIENNDEKRYLLYQVLATGLIGDAYRKFFIFNGAGGNGKSLLSDIMEATIGKYFVRLNKGILCGKDKKIDSSNEHTAGINILNKKRFGIFSETAKDQTINNSRMKDLTGNKYFAGRRMNHEDEFKIQNHATYIVECNSKPRLSEEATDADIERIVDFLFESKFVQNKEDVNENERYYKADTFLKTKLSYLKFGFLEIFIEKAYHFINNDNCQFKIPKCVLERSKEYISSSYTYLEYLRETAIKTKNNDDFIQIKDLYNTIKTTDLYINSTKEERRKITFQSMCDFFANNKYTANEYKEKHYYYSNNIRKGARNVLLGYNFILPEHDEYD